MSNNRFQSNYGGGNITAAQYIVELICEKRAMKENKTLTYKFWTEDEWGAIFKRWLRPVHKLLKTYHPIAIINALNDKKSGLRWSVHTEFMIDMIKHHQRKLSTELKALKVDPDAMEAIKNSVPRKPQLHTSILDVLDSDTEYVNMDIING